jgi:hypothetical protein
MQDEGRTRERLVGVALAGAVALNFPLLYLFGGPGKFFGIPVLYLYVFGIWAALIGLVGLTIHTPPRDRAGGTRGEPPRA